MYQDRIWEVSLIWRAHEIGEEFVAEDKNIKDSH
jgi:hypothetical protein